MARVRQAKLQAIVRSALDEARTLGYAPGEIAGVFEEELALWREENGERSMKNESMNNEE